MTKKEQNVKLEVFEYLLRHCPEDVLDFLHDLQSPEICSDAERHSMVRRESSVLKFSSLLG